MNLIAFNINTLRIFNTKCILRPLYDISKLNQWKKNTKPKCVYSSDPQNKVNNA